MNEFKNYHPFVNLVYFMLVTGFSCIFMNPLCLVISLFCALSYLWVLKGRKALKTMLFTLPLIILMAIINPLFSHNGETVLMYFKNGNPLTLESIIYGGCAAIMIWSVICWFSCFNQVMTSDKIIYLFGKILPSLSLVISMTLRFVPRFIEETKKISVAQKCMGNDVAEGKFKDKVINASAVLSATVTKELENSVETADSMKARGYGLKGRSAYHNFKFTKKDFIWLSFITVCGGTVISGGINGVLKFSFFPSLSVLEFSTAGVMVFSAYFILCVVPVIIEIREVRRWKASK